MSRTLLLFLLLPSLLWAQCNGSYTVELPAFLGNGEGILVPLHIQLFPGEDLILNLSIAVGGSTVESLRDAQAYAASHTTRPCSALVSFPREVERVDGPSGGAYIATALTLLYTNPKGIEKLENVSITGAIDKEGHIYPVGGLYEKAKASLEKGRPIFMAPVGRRLEAFLLDSLPNLTYYSVEELGDVFEALEGRREEGAPHLFGDLLEVKNLSAHIEELEDIYRAIAERYRQALSTTPMPQPYRAYYQRVLERAEEVAERGFYYTAANELFLKLGEVEAIGAFQRGGPEELKGRVEECLSSYQRPNFTKEGFEWAGGSLIRYYRAKAAYEGLEGESPSALYSMEAAARLSEALQWCSLAKEMAGKVEGEPIPEGAFREEAEGLLDRLEGMEVEGMVEYALKEWGEGHYLAFLYLTAPMVVDGEEVEDYDEESLWYRIYHSQALYMEDEELEDYARTYGWLSHVVKGKVEEGAGAGGRAEEKGGGGGNCLWAGEEGRQAASLAFLFFLLFYMAWYHAGGGRADNA